MRLIRCAQIKNPTPSAVICSSCLWGRFGGEHDGPCAGLMSLPCCSILMRKRGICSASWTILYPSIHPGKFLAWKLGRLNLQQEACELDISYLQFALNKIGTLIETLFIYVQYIINHLHFSFYDR